MRGPANMSEVCKNGGKYGSKLVNATNQKTGGVKKLGKCGIYHLSLIINPQSTNLQHICKKYICENPFFRPVIDYQNGETVCPLKVPKSGQCIRFFSCSLFYPQVGVSIIKIAYIYIYIFVLHPAAVC